MCMFQIRGKKCKGEILYILLLLFFFLLPNPFVLSSYFILFSSSSCSCIWFSPLLQLIFLFLSSPGFASLHLLLYFSFFTLQPAHPYLPNHFILLPLLSASSTSSTLHHTVASFFLSSPLQRRGSANSSSSYHHSSSASLVPSLHPKSGPLKLLS